MNHNTPQLDSQSLKQEIEQMFAYTDHRVKTNVLPSLEESGYHHSEERGDRTRQYYAAFIQADTLPVRALVLPEKVPSGSTPQTNRILLETCTRRQKPQPWYTPYLAFLYRCKVAFWYVLHGDPQSTPTWYL